MYEFGVIGIHECFLLVTYQRKYWTSLSFLRKMNKQPGCECEGTR